MDERDKDLTHLFVRDLDEIPLPPRGEWRRAQRRETIAMRSRRYLLTAGAIVAVLAIAPVAGMPPKSGDAMFAIPWATSSMFEAMPPADHSIGNHRGEQRLDRRQQRNS